MAVDLMLSKEDWPLQRQCDFISKVYGLWGGALTVVTFADAGEEAVVQWRYRILHSHQRALFLDGLGKLGIDWEREPPAVVAGKYHYFSNALGGLDMEYVEESPQKTWIRYNAPFGPAGTGWLAIPPRMGRAIFAGWHSHNGERLNCLRLGFVLTKGFNENEPYAEGYFQEYDHDLEPEERIKYASTPRVLEFDPQTAPKLDPELWPPERQMKAKRNFGRGYVEESILALLQMLGTPVTTHIVSRAFQGVAVQYGKELLAELDLTDRNARGLASMIKFLGDMAGDTMEVTSSSSTKYVLRWNHRRLFTPVQVPAKIHRAMFGFYEMLGRMLGQGIKTSLSAVQEEGSPYDEAVIEDVEV